MLEFDACVGGAEMRVCLGLVGIAVTPFESRSEVFALRRIANCQRRGIAF